MRKSRGSLVPGNIREAGGIAPYAAPEELDLSLATRPYAVQDDWTLLPFLSRDAL